MFGLQVLILPVSNCIAISWFSNLLGTNVTRWPVKPRPWIGVL